MSRNYFMNQKSLELVGNIVQETTMAIVDESRNIENSPIDFVLTPVFRLEAEEALSFVSLYGLGAMESIHGIGGDHSMEPFKHPQLNEEKLRLYQAALVNQTALVRLLDTNIERIEYLTALDILLQKAIEELRADLS